MKSSTHNLKTMSGQNEPTVTISHNRSTRKDPNNRFERGYAGSFG